MRTDNRPNIDFALDLDFGEILTNPILDIAARFWEDDRYAAFKICYRSMRAVDDLVDNQKVGGAALTADEQNLFASMIDDWINALRRGRADDQFQEELLEVLNRFQIPIWPWERLATAMTYDLYHNGFATFHKFLRYTEGAAIAPAAVFMHLCGVTPAKEGYRPATFDIRREARPLAVFSYLVHIMRDFQKDQQDHLNYFADNIVAGEGLTEQDLRLAATGGPINRPLRDLFARYKAIADYYRRLSRVGLDVLMPRLAPRYQLSLEIIYTLYLQIFERVNPDTGSFTGTELNPTPDEVQERIDRTIDTFRSR